MWFEVVFNHGAISVCSRTQALNLALLPALQRCLDMVTFKEMCFTMEASETTNTLGHHCTVPASASQCSNACQTSSAPLAATLVKSSQKPLIQNKRTPVSGTRRTGRPRLEFVSKTGSPRLHWAPGKDQQPWSHCLPARKTTVTHDAQLPRQQHCVNCERWNQKGFSRVGSLSWPR